MKNPFRYFNSSPEVIRLVVMMYVRYPLSLRNVEDLLAERGIDMRHETVRFWWNRFGPMFAAEIRRKRVRRMQECTSMDRFSHGRVLAQHLEPPYTDPYVRWCGRGRLVTAATMPISPP